jgi:hypothetical protein
LGLVNQLYFVFDIETYKNNLEEIVKKIDNKAGIYVYSPISERIHLIDGVKFTELEEKDETFYRTILFNYLFRNGLKSMNKGGGIYTIRSKGVI